MKLNNKGITIVEIIISVALISIVLIFLFNLLIQVNNENDDNNIRSSYLVNQSAFIKQIEEDFIDQELSSGTKCISDDLSITETTGKLVLPRIYENTFITTGNDINIKCLKFTYKDNHNSYVFIYKRIDGTSFKTILSYYNNDFKQTEELEDFIWKDNLGYDVIDEDSTALKSYSLPIVGPDQKDYSINLSYAY